jgi:hypothetical protein
VDVISINGSAGEYGITFWQLLGYRSYSASFLAARLTANPGIFGLLAFIAAAGAFAIRSTGSQNSTFRPSSTAANDHRWTDITSADTAHHPHGWWGNRSVDNLHRPILDNVAPCTYLSLGSSLYFAVGDLIMFLRKSTGTFFRRARRTAITTQ